MDVGVGRCEGDRLRARIQRRDMNMCSCVGVSQTDKPPTAGRPLIFSIGPIRREAL